MIAVMHELFCTLSLAGAFMLSRLVWWIWSW